MLYQYDMTFLHKQKGPTGLYPRKQNSNVLPVTHTLLSYRNKQTVWGKTFALFTML